MKCYECPVCHVEMEEVHYQQMSVDRCTNCGGIWLGEVEVSMLQKQMLTKYKKQHRGTIKTWFLGLVNLFNIEDDKK